jgi:hypothetical protein
MRTDPDVNEPVFRLHEPVVDGHEVRFSWDVSPPTELYLRTEFRLWFPQDLNLARVPKALWLRVMLICLHAHFALLRPCVVVLPGRIGAAEREFWQRLIDNVAVQLEAYGGAPRPGRAARLVDSGPRSRPARVPVEADRAVVAFSGGKDSTVLAGLAAELTERPLLVSVTSPVPWARDHVGAARERARTEIANRLPVDVLEVQSDFRSSWQLGFSRRDGCTFGVHELSDLPLYHGAMAAVAAARGMARTMMASEADLQYNAVLGGKTILERDPMSCAVMQGALDALLVRFGLRQGSLTYPLHVPQVEGLLLRRYRHLADFQFSCWQAPPGEQACSACRKCFGLALLALAEGISPRAIGIDPVSALCAFSDWRVDGPRPEPGPVLSEYRTGRHHMERALQRRPTGEVAALLANERDSRRKEALAVYARLHEDAMATEVPPAPGYVTPFLELVHDDLRDPLKAILAQHFEPTDEPELAAMAARSKGLTNWIASPLERRRWPRWR